MNGDLGNLLTGEMGEAESRFAYDDFAEAYGRRVMGRVRRRRAARAAGVGGGTMLTAGALVVGATHMPWGALGAAAGMGGSDCVTPSPSDVVSTHSAAVSTDHGSAWEISFLDAASGSTIMRGAQQPDGTYRFTDGDGKPLSATPGVAGYYTVELPAGVTSLESTSITTVLGGETNAGASFSVPSLAEPVGPTPSPSDDCYTPSPAPSGAPSLTTDMYTIDPSPAAKPEDVTSPFQCGFVMDSLSQGSSHVAITDTTWVTPAAYNASLKEKWGMSADLPLELGSASVPTVRVRVDPTSFGRWGGSVGPGDPKGQSGNMDSGTPTVVTGYDFVMVRDGVVVATMDTTTRGKDQHLVLNHDNATDTNDVTLVNAADGFVACPGKTLEPNTGTVFAVAGSYVKDKSGVNSTSIDYSWVALEPN